MKVVAGVDECAVCNLIAGEGEQVLTAQHVARPRARRRRGLLKVQRVVMDDRSRHAAGSKVISDPGERGC